MFKRLTLPLVAFMALTFAPAVDADPLVPTVSNPKNFSEYQYGLGEVRENIDSLSCGGWTDTAATVGVTPPGPPAKVVFTCKAGIRTCGGSIGQTGLKQEDGTIPICISNGDSVGGTDEPMLLHELVHAKQEAPFPPGWNPQNTAAECCQREGEAYTTQCNAVDDAGWFATPVNGVRADVASCVLRGQNTLSCASWGQNPCGPPISADMDAALTAGFNNKPRVSCTDITTHPTPRMQQILDEIERISWQRPAGTGVTGTVPIPTVSDDFPGRNNIDPLGNPGSGLSYRGNFQFPDSAFGLSSACDVFLHEYIDPDLEKKEIDLVWHIDKPDDPKTKVTFEIKRGGTGRVETNPERWCERYPKATPAWCLKLYTTLGDLKKFADDHPADLRPNPLTLCPDPNSPGPPKLYCFDFKSECHGSECATDEMPDFFNKLAECSPGAPDPDGNLTYNYTDYGYQVASQSSFYRHYQGMVTAPTKTWQVRAECYEWYKGTNKDKTIFDPKTTVTTGIGDGGGKDNDEQCEIVIKTPSEQSPLPPEWLDAEGADGRKQKENVPLSSSASSEPARDPRPAPAPWVTDDQTNLSIVDIKKLRELQKGFDDPDDITGAIGAIIPAKQRASATTPEHARSDAFDHTDHRDFAAFWEAQQKELLTMTRDPTVRLLLPARFLTGLRTASPLFQYVNGTVSTSDGTVELTLRAGGDDLGSAVRTLMETYVLPISEVPVPILIPITTADEIDKLIAQWKQWKLYPENAPYRTRADELIARLQSYQVALRRNQLLRTALEKELTHLYEPIRTFSGKMATWTKDNTDTLLKAAEHAKQRQQLKRIWRHIQNSMLQADACLLQWCSNQRYSVPVYSLLDNWWGDAPGQSPRNQRYLPPDDLRSLAYRAPADQVYDFSSLSLPRSQMRIPILEVIQTALRLPTPPLAGSAPLPASEYKDIPMVPNPADILSAFPVPDVKVASLPVIPDPVLPGLEPAKTILRTLRVKIDGTSVDQQKFEEAFEDEENGGVVYDEGNDIPLDRHTMRGAYCRFPPSITAPPDPEQKSAIPQKIIHIENDLRERIAFAFSRWMPERTEDFAGRVARLHQEFPVPSRQPKCHEDIVCAFLPNTKTTTVTWQLFLPTVTVNVTAIADRLKALTLPASESKNPYINAPSPLLKRLFPNLSLPIDIDLSPQP